MCHSQYSHSFGLQIGVCVCLYYSFYSIEVIKEEHLKLKRDDDDESVLVVVPDLKSFISNIEQGPGLLGSLGWHSPLDTIGLSSAVLHSLTVSESPVFQAGHFPSPA